MSIDIRLKHSATLNKAPQPADLKDGELALNTNAASPAAYIKDSAGNIVKLAGDGSVGSDKRVKKAGDTMTGDLNLPNLVATGDVQSTSQNGGALAGFRNVIINGDFRVWQRGTSFTSGGYTADRWQASGLGGSTRTVSQYIATETTGMQVIFTSGGNAGSRTMIQQKIESVRVFAGQEVTLSFEARSTNITQISTDVQQFFGSGGSPSATTTFGGKKHTGIATAWKRFSVTFNVPSVDGKTIGTTSALDCLQVNFFLEAGSDFDGRTDSLGTQSGSIILRNVQLEPGPVATPFEHRPIGAELALCQRYYAANSGMALSMTRLTLSGGNEAQVVGYVTFPVSMRATPTVTMVVNSGSSPVTNPDPSGFRGRVNIATTSASSISAYTADAEL